MSNQQCRIFHSQMACLQYGLFHTISLDTFKGRNLTLLEFQGKIPKRIQQIQAERLKETFIIVSPGNSRVYKWKV